MNPPPSQRNDQLNKLKGVFKEIGTAFKDLTEDIADRLDSLRDGSMKGLAAAFKGLSETFSMSGRMAEVVQGALVGIGKAADALYSGSLQRLKEAFKSVYESVGGGSDQTKQAIDGIKMQMRQLGDASEAAVDKLKAEAAEINAAYDKKAGRLRQHIKDASDAGDTQKAKKLQQELQAVEGERSRKLKDNGDRQGKVRREDRVQLRHLRDEEEGLQQKLKQQLATQAQMRQSFATIASVGQMAFAGITSAVVGLGSLASPAMFQQFTMAMKDLGAVVGQILLPIFDAFIKIVRGLADRILNLSPATKNLVGAFAAVAIGVGAVIVVVSGLIAAFSSLNVVSGGILLTIGAVVTGLAAVGAWLGSTSAGSKILKTIWEGMGPVMDSFSLILESIAEVLGEVGAAMGELLASLGLLDANIWESLIKGIVTANEKITQMILLFGVLAQAIKNPLKVLALDKAFEEAGKRFDALKKKMRDASSVGAAPGKASFMGIEDLGKMVATAALEMGAAQQQAEEVKKRQQQADDDEKKRREEASAAATVLSAERLNDLFKFAAGPLAAFVAAARIKWEL